jgi:F0F1-type ATP synthase alpha subunit
MKDWEEALTKFMGTQYAGILQAIDTEKRLSDETTAALKQACEEFKKSWS